MIDLFFKKLFEWDQPETKGRVALFRILELFLFIQIVTAVWQWAFYIYELQEVILPLGLANYIDVKLLFGTIFPFLNAGLISALLLIGLIRKWKFAYLCSVLLFHLQYVARYSQGEISHGSNLAGIILICIGASIAFFKNERDARKIAWGLIFFFVGFGYVSAAFSKLIGTGFNWADGNHLKLWIEERSIDKLSQKGTFTLSFFQNLLLQNWWLSTAILSFGWLVEFCGFLFWFRKTRWIQATLLMSMHLGIVFTMNIYFGSYVYFLLIIGYPWDKIFDKYIFK